MDDVAVQNSALNTPKQLSIKIDKEQYDVKEKEYLSSEEEQQPLNYN